MIPALDAEGSKGLLAANVMHFARLLRAAGLRIGPDRVLDSVRALELADLRAARGLVLDDVRRTAVQRGAAPDLRPGLPYFLERSAARARR